MTATTMLKVKPTAKSFVNLFDGECDNERSMPDLDFVVCGLDAPLKLHKSLLCVASDLVFNVTKCRQRQRRFVWQHDTSCKEDRDALVKVLRFFYGETHC